MLRTRARGRPWLRWRQGSGTCWPTPGLAGGSIWHACTRHVSEPGPCLRCALTLVRPVEAMFWAWICKGTVRVRGALPGALLSSCTIADPGSWNLPFQQRSFSNSNRFCRTAVVLPAGSWSRRTRTTGCTSNRGRCLAQHMCRTRTAAPSARQCAILRVVTVACNSNRWRVARNDADHAMGTLCCVSGGEGRLQRSMGCVRLGLWGAAGCCGFCAPRACVVSCGRAVAGQHISQYLGGLGCGSFIVAIKVCHAL